MMDNEKKGSEPFEVDVGEVCPPVSETVYVDEEGNEYKQ